MPASSTTTATASRVSKGVTCEECYFRRQALCALVLEHPCPTFRAAGRTLEPPHQARLLPRVAAAY